MAEYSFLFKMEIAHPNAKYSSLRSNFIFGVWVRIILRFAPRLLSLLESRTTPTPTRTPFNSTLRVELLPVWAVLAIFANCHINCSKHTHPHINKPT